MEPGEEDLDQIYECLDSQIDCDVLGLAPPQARPRKGRRKRAGGKKKEEEEAEEGVDEIVIMKEEELSETEVKEEPVEDTQ